MRFGTLSLDGNVSGSATYTEGFIASLCPFGHCPKGNACVKQVSVTDRRKCLSCPAAQPDKARQDEWISEENFSHN